MASTRFKRYSVHWVNLDPARGRELRKIRPAVIVSRDELNAALDTVVICPLTSRLHPTWPTRVTVRVGSKDSEVAVDQIRVVSQDRLGTSLGRLAPAEAAELREVIRVCYAE